jgi:RNA binding exosome subunit
VPEKIVEKIFEAPQITTEEYKKYYGKEVAIYKNRIVASGRTASEALKKALKECPEAKAEEIVIDYIQSADVMIL